MFEAIHYLVSSKKLEDGFGMDNVAMVNSRGKITRSSDDNMGLDLQFVHNNIACVLHDFFVSSWCSLIEGVINKIYNLLHHILG